MNERTLTHLDLFSGIGGFSLGFEAEGFRTVAFVEFDAIKNVILKYWWPEVPNLGDVRDCERIAEFCRAHGPIDVLTGGVPCQPASSLGQMRGTADERWMWPAAIRLVSEIRPRFAVFENPPALLTLEDGRAWNGIVSELVACGYDLFWDVFPAAAIGAGHLRERVILIAAYAGSIRGNSRERKASAEPNSGSEGRMGTNGESKIRTPSDAEGEQSRLGSRIAVSAGRAPQNQPAGEGESKSPANANNGISQNLQADPLADGGQAWEVFASGSNRGVEQSNAANPNQPRLQRHGRHEAGNVNGGGNEKTRRPTAPPDLRGRVHGQDWWQEAHTGIPVLADGISSKLAEAASKCAGDSILPQIAQIIARAIRQIEGGEIK